MMMDVCMILSLFCLKDTFVMIILENRLQAF